MSPPFVFFTPMRNILQKFAQRVAEGRILRSKSLQLVDEHGCDGANCPHFFNMHETPFQEIDMDKDFVAELSFVVTRADGTPFAEFHHKYHRMDLGDVVEFEEFLVDVLGQMSAWGKAKVEEKMARSG